MQQRQLRLGDILDDYCPRERRLTNHAVVAKIDDDVRQTRCLTCNTEHEYRQGKAPTLRKKKDNVAAAYREVLAEVTKGAPGASAPPEVEARQDEGAAPAEALTHAPDTPVLAAAPDEAAPAPPAEPVRAAAPVAAAEGAQEGAAEPSDAGEGVEAEEARVHRRLIRATLPRTDNQPVVRPIPQFTMRQPTPRPAKFRPSTGRSPRPAAGARVTAAGSGRFPARGVQHASRPGRAEGPRTRGPQHPRHGKKHSK